MNEIINSFPAYDIVKPTRTYHDVPVIEAGEALAIFTNDDYHGRFSEAYFHSVVSYALESNADPIAWLEKARAKKEELHWVTRVATSLTAEPQERRTLKGLHVGQWVRFEGRYFCIQSAPNRNFKLVSIDTE